MVYNFEILGNEYWYGGCCNEATTQPYDKNSEFHHEYSHDCTTQGAPLYISTKGRYIWSEDAFDITIKDGIISIESELEVTMNDCGSTLRDAYLSAMKAHFPFSGKVPERDFFKAAQYNGWMEFTYSPNQEGILDYARMVIKSGFVPGIFIIDGGWQNNYGDWTFDTRRFPDPKAMVDELHALGFKVMLWVVPYVASCGLKFISQIREDLNQSGNASKIFLRNEKGEPAIQEWWSGYSAMLDLTNPTDCEFLESQLKALMDEYGVDGFKFDGGSRTSYHPKRFVNGSPRDFHGGKYSPLKQNEAWLAFGSRFAYHEYKDTFKGGGKPTVQRLMDRRHRWERDGINTIIPNSLVQGILGHPFICPDMIGGGEWSDNVKPGFKIDEELFIRMAQASVFFPMMQFSWAPWKRLSEESWKIVARFGRMHAEVAPEIIKIIEESAVTGEPVLRFMEYQFPGNGYEKILDQYMVGDDILVCPIVTKGTFEKDVVIPDGTWVDELGNTFTKGTHRIPTPIERLPYFRRVK